MPKFGFINLQEEADTLIKEYGYWVALRSVDLTTKTNEAAELVNAQYDQSNPDFQHIVNNYAFVDKLVQGYRYLAQPGFDHQTQVGALNTKLRVFIIRSDKRPRNTDFILELALDEDTGELLQPFSIRRVWNIQDAEPMRAGQPFKHAGGIEFYRCFVEEDNLGYGNRPT